MPSVAAAARQMQVAPASIAKTLVFTDGDAIVVAVAPGDRRVLPQRLAASVGMDALHMARRDDVLCRTGYLAGAVAPVAFLHAVHVVVDRALLAHQRVLAGAGEYDLLLDIAVNDIVACNRAVIAPITQKMET
ncbi:aminoacyl-tRNA deacylase [Paraburkholderia sediminicola]|uniref:aminoacyl-tRNA deacylase n=1 Tax=Paraburkholderia sediminicola TaxID=458836 RepID=UPI0038B9DB7B